LEATLRAVEREAKVQGKAIRGGIGAPAALTSNKMGGEVVTGMGVWTPPKKDAGPEKKWEKHCEPSENPGEDQGGKLGQARKKNAKFSLRERHKRGKTESDPGQQKRGN